ncbi:ankyrin repeat domain-containing protein [Curtobacterium sp. MCLR17_054]|uniref:ankyrin repeat domain-containing protein n=1 Tax=Curtobacterium sp. MCLR17_054 TaxID=2175632 RepID=UPI000DA9C9A5|nr:ankyrin repeat domain-containing protein [Curtobacterium sp. MCLR17_054]WIE69181.1 ankyrin repeat domain-containing protein [Curtobacterium sp. MCLR17_054]
MSTAMDSSAFWDAIIADDAQAITRIASEGFEVSSASRANADALTPLHFAAQTGAVHAMRALLALGAEVDSPDRWGTTPLQLAVTNSGDRLDPVAVLLDAGADPCHVNDFGATPLSYARILGDAPAGLIAMLQQDRVFEHDEAGVSVVFEAATHGSLIDIQSAVHADAALLNSAVAGETPLRLLVRRSLPVRPNRSNPHPVSVDDAVAGASAMLSAGAKARLVGADGFTAQGLARAFLAPKPLIKVLDRAAKLERRQTA